MKVLIVNLLVSKQLCVCTHMHRCTCIPVPLGTHMHVKLVAVLYSPEGRSLV